MRKLLLLPLGLLAIQHGFTQDSATAVYINSVIARIETNLAYDASVIRDTAIYDEADTTPKPRPLQIHTEYFFKGRTNQIEKITEESHYSNWTTNTIVYYLNGQPIRFTTLEKHADTVKVDFDIYYMNNSPVHCVKRNPARGQPNGDTFLKWSYELLRSYRD